MVQHFTFFNSFLGKGTCLLQRGVNYLYFAPKRVSPTCVLDPRTNLVLHFIILMFDVHIKKLLFMHYYLPFRFTSAFQGLDTLFSISS
jgi:hypothetical protein